jgi:tetratricopeptide (TPR) repeat protein
MERHEQAVDAYSRTIDLQPNQLLALLGRAQAHEALGDRDAAIADYSSALVCDPTQWEALANRAALYYEACKPEAALADVGIAIGLAPDQIGLYQNRSLVLAKLGRYEEAARDPQTALLYHPTEDERSSLRQQLGALQELVSAVPVSQQAWGIRRFQLKANGRRLSSAAVICSLIRDGISLEMILKVAEIFGPKISASYRP